MPKKARTETLGTDGAGAVIRRTVLPGGLRVVTETMPWVRSASVGVWVDVGSRDESPSVAGASHFLEHLLFKGTPTRSALDIAIGMDAVGGEFNAFTEKEHTCYYATVLDRDVDYAVDVICDVVLSATVAARDVEVERHVVLEEISMRDDDPSDLVSEEFATAVFGDSPLGRSILGSDASITAMTRRQVAGYYHRRYEPGDMVVAVAGNVSHADVVARVRQAFAGRLDPGHEAPAPRGTAAGVAARFADRPSTRVSGDDTEQANIMLGVRGLSRHDPRRYAVGVLSAALGGGMSSRLFQRIREERGLAYSVYSFHAAYADTGMFGVYAGCQPAKADEVLSLMRSELASVARDGLSADEIERGKGQARGGMVIGLEDSASRMTRIGKSELVSGEVLTVDAVLGRIEAVTDDDVRAVAADLFAQPRALAVVGPFDDHAFDAGDDGG
ncbi:M16 family metallopeptidase [Jatrophihabitans sp. YIM 134969]